MKLFSYPYLVQKEIIDHLTFNHMFFLALCSKRTKHLIKHIRKYQFEKVEQVTYCIKDETTTIELFSDSFWAQPLKCFKACISDAEYVRVNELGPPIDFYRCPEIKSDMLVKYDPENVESAIEAIHNHFLDLMGPQTKYWLEITQEEDVHYFPILRNIQMLEVMGYGFDMKRINEFLSRSTCLEYVLWTTRFRQEIVLEENSKFFELDTLYICTARNFTTDVLRKFNGRHVFLKSLTVLTTDAIQFLNDWRSGKKYQNLEVISMENRFNIPMIRNWVEFNNVTTEVEYSFDRKFPDRDTRSFDDDPSEFKSHFYMVRKSDGRVASVKLTDSSIIMGVWNMTEKVFLEMFQ